MKKILFFIFLFMFLINNVYADAGFSGEGSTSGSAGTISSGTTSSGLALSLSPGMRFSLVDVSGTTMNVKIARTMFNKDSKYYKEYFKNKNANGSGVICGWINSSEYSSWCYDLSNQPEFPDTIYNEWMNSVNSIVPTHKIMTNFDVGQLKNAIMLNETQITQRYENLVIYLLEESGIISKNSVTKLDDLDNSIKSILNNYRVIIEPIYVLTDESNFHFYTTKAIGVLAKNSGKSYGVSMDKLYANLYAVDTVNTVINYPKYSSSGSYEKNLANVNHGAGYAVVRLSYNIPDVKQCFIDFDTVNNKYIFYDSVGNSYVNNLDSSDGGVPGSNFEYLLDECGCDAIDNSLYRNDLLTNELLNNKYTNECVKKICDYEVSGGSYTFYKKDGSITYDYKVFLNSCGCNNSKVLELKGTFDTAYSNACNSKETFIPHGEFGVCTLNNTVSLTRKKNVNEYCTRTCKEIINFNNVVDTSSKTYNAGEYFKLDYYPELEAQKSCVLDFDYTNWENNYKYYLNLAAEAYSGWKKYSSVSSSLTGGECAGADGIPIPEYKYNFSWSGFKSNASLILTQFYDSYSFTQCGSINFYLSANSYYEDYLQYSAEIENLKSYMNSCNDAIDFEGNNFYDFESELEFHYQQDIIENDIIKPTWNENRYFDDSRMSSSDPKDVKKYCNGLETPSDICNFSEIELYDSISGNSIQKNKSKIYSANDLSREEKFKIEYQPSIPKFASNLYGKVNTNSSGFYLGNVYDLDYNAKEKNENDNYFKFISLGENSNDVNSLFQRLLQYNQNALSRWCTYNINNDVFECEDCNNGQETDFNFVYKMVDPANIDPNDRLSDNKGFKNWKTEKALAVKNKIESDAVGNNTYNPDNLEYSFELDSSMIQEIRELNKERDNYSDFIDYECNNGNECKSDFVSDYAIKDNNDNLKGIGRDSWKTYIKNSSNGKCYIDNEEVECP